MRLVEAGWLLPLGLISAVLLFIAICAGLFAAQALSGSIDVNPGGAAEIAVLSIVVCLGCVVGLVFIWTGRKRD
jgi:hypothetical protein